MLQCCNTFIPIDIHMHIQHILYRSSRPEVFCKKGVLKNFTKFTGKHLCQSLFFNKVAGLRPATLLKKRLWHRCFPVNFVKFLRTPFYIEHLWRLLLTFNMNTSLDLVLCTSLLPFLSVKVDAFFRAYLL